MTKTTTLTHLSFAALLSLAPLAVAQADPASERRLAALLQESQGAQLPLRFFERLAQLDGLELDRTEILRTLASPGFEITGTLPQMLQTATSIRVEDGKVAVDLEAPTSASLQAGTLRLGEEIRYRRDREGKLHVARGIEVGNDTGTFPLRSVEQEGDGALKLVAGEGPFRRTVRVTPEGLTVVETETESESETETESESETETESESETETESESETETELENGRLHGRGLVDLLNDAAEGKPVLRRGDSGEAVQSMQRLLNRHRDPGESALQAEGQFGPRTARAVRDFQRERGLPVTGEVDAATWDALLEESADEAADTGVGSPALWRGDRGESVRELQRLLNLRRREQGLPPIAEDGIFGRGTERAARDFQASRGIDGTGTVDAATWDALRNVGPANERGSDLPGLQRGSRGSDVSRLQKLINEERWNAGLPPIAVDGQYGPGTAAAVADMQERAGLPSTGRVDAGTWDELLGQGPLADAGDFGRDVTDTPANGTDAGNTGGSSGPSTGGSSSVPASSTPGGSGTVGGGSPRPGSDSQPVEEPVVDAPLGQPPITANADERLLVQIQQRAVASARRELALGVTENRGANRGTRVDVYARTAGMSPGYDWCGFFASYNLTTAARELGKTFSAQTKLHSVGKIRAWAMYRSYTQSWTSRNVANWEAERRAHAQAGPTRKYFVFSGSNGERYARNNGLQAEVVRHYNALPVRPGDIVIWSRGGGNGHIGLVEGYNPLSGTLTTIEGNTSNRVRRKVYELSTAAERARIDGFARPAQGDFR